MPDQTIWDVPVGQIALHKAGRMVENGAYETESEAMDAIKVEFEDTAQPIEWMRKEMKWAEIAPHAKIVTKPIQAYSYAYMMAETEVVVK